MRRGGGGRFLVLALVAMGLWTWYSSSQAAALAVQAPFGVFPEGAGQAPAWKVAGTTYYGSNPGVAASSQALSNCPICTSSGSFWTCVCQ